MANALSRVVPDTNRRMILSIRHGQVWMKDAGYRNPTRKDRFQPIPGQHAALTATTQNQPPQAAQTLPEDT
jgi:hypothetical protein